MKCEVCGKGTLKDTELSGVYTCRKCGAVQGTIYKGDSYNVVLPYMLTVAAANKAEAEGTVRAYDLTVLGSNGIERRHGWFDTTTRCIIQAG